MRAVSAADTARSAEIVRRNALVTEESFGSILGDVVRLLYPAPNTAAQLASQLDCTVRNVELCLSGKQKWSGDAVAFIVAEIMRRHAMRNFRVAAKG